MKNDIMKLSIKERETLAQKEINDEISNWYIVVNNGGCWGCGNCDGGPCKEQERGIVEYIRKKYGLEP